MPTHKHKVGNLGGDYGMDVEVDAGLDNIHLAIDELPEVVSRVKELPRIELGDINTNISVKEMPRIELGDINTNISVKEMPRIEVDANTTSTLDVSLKEIPDVRAHLPAHYNLGISIFGIEVVNFSLCGESQVITEKFVPRRMELCR